MMISQENLDAVKEVLYNNYIAKNSKIIGDLMTLRNLIDTVLHDTSYNKFRIVEACHFLDGQGYLKYMNSANEQNMFGVIVFYITDKLINEQRERQTQDQEDELNLKKWY